MKIPAHHDLFNPLLDALQQLGGSGTIDEIESKVYEILKLPDDVANAIHGKDGNQTEVEYRLAWARTYLKKYGLLENSSRGVWSIIPEKKDIRKVNQDEVLSFVRDLEKEKKSKSSERELNSLDDNDIDAPEEVRDWKDNLREILLVMEPDAFERLIQRMLRESGFSQVEVTGKTGDGGIDGKGIFKIGGLISFNVLFQCKRWQASINSKEIRDFRGALQGRADKGLFVTTSNFTRDAIKEATRDGAPPIDLIDGDQLVNKLKELKLGLKVEYIENVLIDDKWYKAI